MSGRASRASSSSGGRGSASRSDAALERRFDALSGELDWRQLGTAADGKPPPDARFALGRPFPVRLLDGPLYYLPLPRRIARELRRFQPTPSSPRARRRPRSRSSRGGSRAREPRSSSTCTATGEPRRGSTARRRGACSIRCRTRSRAGRCAAPTACGRSATYTTGIVRAEGIEPAAEFPAYMDLEPFTAEPVAALPAAPRALFVGVLERYKAFDVLADAWRLVAAEVPDAVLHVVGQGTLAPVACGLVRELPGRVEWTPVAERRGRRRRARRRDAARAAVALGGHGARRRRGGVPRRGPVVGSRVGGIPDVVADGETGSSSRRATREALADALVRVLADRALAERLGAEARRRVEPWLATPEEYARRVRELVDKVVGIAAQSADRHRAALTACLVGRVRSFAVSAAAERRLERGDRAASPRVRVRLELRRASMPTASAVYTFRDCRAARGEDSASAARLRRPIASTRRRRRPPPHPRLRRSIASSYALGVDARRCRVHRGRSPSTPATASQPRGPGRVR